MEKDGEGRYIYPGTDITISEPGVYLEIWYPEENNFALYLAELSNEGTEFTDKWGNTQTGWTFSSNIEGNVLTGYTTKYGNGEYGFFTGSTSSANEIGYGSEFTLERWVKRKYCLSLLNYKDGSRDESYDNELDSESIVTSDGWYITSYGDQYNGKYKNTGVSREIWTSRWASSTSAATIFERIGDGLKIYAVFSDNNENVSDAYQYKETTSQSSPATGIGNMWYYTIATAEKYFNDEFPGVEYNEQTDEVLYNPMMPPVYMSGTITGHPSMDQSYYEVVDEKPWEHFGITDEVFAKYSMALKGKHAIYCDYNVKLNGMWATHRCYNTDGNYIMFGFGGNRFGRFRGYRIAIDGQTRTVRLEYYNEGMS